ncbi:MAG: 30S ribosomal protein THX [Ignavibacteriales bacterium]
MGRGDKKSKKGKRFQHSYGKTRQRKKHSTPHFVKVEEKPKPIEIKKIFRPEHETRKPVVLDTPVEHIKIEQPEIVEVKEAIKQPVLQSPESSKQHEIVHTVKKEEKKKEEPKKSAIKEETKKRGRPKKTK